jgi:hypothetical protein
MFLVIRELAFIVPGADNPEPSAGADRYGERALR